MNHQNISHRPTLWVILLLVGWSLTLAGGCSADMADADGGYENGSMNSTASAPDISAGIRDAELALQHHRVDNARGHYVAVLNEDPDHGAAAAGLALTELMLLLELSEVTTLLMENLGAAFPIDANRLIFAEGGYLYWASRGARWDDDGPYEGIQSILSDEIPWTKEQLAAIAIFVEGQDEPVDKLVRQLVTVANALRGIDYNLEVALNDPNFTRLYVPGQVFYDDALTLRLGRSEIASMRALLALARSAIYFLAAYEHSWTLEGAFGSWRYQVALDDPKFVPTFSAVDYSVAYLDDHLFRAIVNPERLAASRSALRDALAHGQAAIRHGLEDQFTTTLEWDDVDVDDAYHVDALLGALGDALDGPTELPYAEPAGITLDLRPLFEDEGRILDEGISWFRRLDSEGLGISGDSLDAALDLWEFRSNAVEAFWMEGIVDGLNDEDLALHSDPLKMIDVLIHSYWTSVEEIYLSTR